MEEIMGVGFVCVIGVIFALQFKQSKPEYSLLIGLSMCVLIFMKGMEGLGGILETTSKLSSYLGENKQYLGIVRIPQQKSKHTKQKCIKTC